jgi:hypothetical protein
MASKYDNYPPFEITDSLLNELTSKLTDLRDDDIYADVPSGRGNDEGETGVLKKLIPHIDDTKATDPSEDLFAYITAKKYHSSPKVKFKYNGQTKKVELADVLFLITYMQSDTVAARGSMLSQTKYEKSGDTQKWEICPPQFYLLHEMPSFIVSNISRITRTFSLSARRQTFTNYSLVGQSYAPFLHTTEGMTDNNSFRYPNHGATQYTYRRSVKPHPNQNIVTWLRYMTRGRYAEPLVSGDDMMDLVTQLFSQSTFPYTDSQDRLPTPTQIQSDGGTPPNEETDDSFAVVHLTVGRDCTDDIMGSRHLHIRGEM